MLQRISKLVVLLAVLVSTSCVDANTSFYISGNVMGSKSGSSSGGATCTYSTSGSLLVTGYYDTGYAVSDGGEYYLHLLYDNALRNHTTAISTNPNGIYVTEVKVEIQTFDGATVGFSGLANPFTMPASTFIASSSGSTSSSSSSSSTSISKGVGSVIGIPASYGQQLDGMTQLDGVNLVVRASGHTSGGTHVETDDFYWPVIFRQLTNVCGTSAYTPCNVGQDQPETIVCCTSSTDCDDGNECTVDTCGADGLCTNTNVMDGTSCNSGSGTCTAGVCG